MGSALPRLGSLASSELAFEAGDQGENVYAFCLPGRHHFVNHILTALGRDRLCKSLGAYQVSKSNSRSFGALHCHFSANLGAGFCAFNVHESLWRNQVSESHWLRKRAGSRCSHCRRSGQSADGQYDSRSERFGHDEVPFQVVELAAAVNHRLNSIDGAFISVASRRWDEL